MKRVLLGLAIGLGLAAVLGGPAAAQDLPLPGIQDAGAPVVEEEIATDQLHLLRSPRATMETFLVAMNDLWSDPGAWERAELCLDLRLEDPAASRERVRQLYAVLNRIAKVDVEALPDAGAAEALDRFRYFPDRSRDRGLMRRLGTPAGAIAFENFFGSVAVVLDRPFDIGDWVVIDDTEAPGEEAEEPSS